MKKQNGFGAIVNSYVAAWRFSNLQVDFEGTVNTTEMGTINIVTNKGVEFLAGPDPLEHPKQRTQIGPKL